MARNRHKNKKEGKKYQIELSPVSLLLWSFGLFFLLSWIFALGVMVGRGFLPEAVTALADLKGQINRLQEIVSRSKQDDAAHTKEKNPEPKLAFYDRLSSKKEETKSKPLPENKSPTPGKDLTQQFAIQFASLIDMAMAKEMVNKLNGKGCPAYFYEVTVKGKTYYRVRSKDPMSKEDAQKYAIGMEKDKGIKGIVVRIE